MPAAAHLQEVYRPQAKNATAVDDRMTEGQQASKRSRVSTTPLCRLCSTVARVRLGTPALTCSLGWLVPYRIRDQAGRPAVQQLVAPWHCDSAVTVACSCLRVDTLSWLNTLTCSSGSLSMR